MEDCERSRSMSKKRKINVTVIKGPHFDRVMQNAYGFINQMLQKKLREGGEKKIKQA